jgi:hypothetical protein
MPPSLCRRKSASMATVGPRGGPSDITFRAVTFEAPKAETSGKAERRKETQCVSLWFLNVDIGCGGSRNEHQNFRGL